MGAICKTMNPEGRQENGHFPPRRHFPVFLILGRSGPDVRICLLMIIGLFGGLPLGLSRPAALEIARGENKTTAEETPRVAPFQIASVRLPATPSKREPRGSRDHSNLCVTS